MSYFYDQFAVSQAQDFHHGYTLNTSYYMKLDY